MRNDIKQRITARGCRAKLSELWLKKAGKGDGGQGPFGTSKKQKTNRNALRKFVQNEPV